MTARAYVADAVFEGTMLLPGAALVVEHGVVVDLSPVSRLDDSLPVTRLGPGTIAPGFVDLQVNGGAGLMLGDAPGPETLRAMAEAHASLGATSILPTLITDAPDVTAATIEAVTGAVAAGLPGIAGLHLEGPHLAPARKGAHDGGLMHAMSEADVARYCAAVGGLGVLMITLAPEAATPEQIAALTGAGVIVSLGHSDAPFETCMAAFRAGARCATHLFNAMSQLGSRAPGLVGAALAHGPAHAGLIADGVHVHPETIALALRAKKGPGQVFLVSDAMAVAGSDLQRFALGGREITRAQGRLTLADGTLAGADLDLARALRVMTRDAGLSLERALGMATSGPAAVIGAADRLGHLQPGRAADFVWLDADLGLSGVWRAGKRV